MPAKRLKPRLKPPTEESLTPEQRAMREAVQQGPRKTFKLYGPLGVWIHAPVFGEMAQRLGGHCRFHTALPPRLSEFAIIVTARQWRAQYEWQAHAVLAEKAGVKPRTIADIRAGRVPKSAPADERAIFQFIAELYRHKRVSDRTYGKVVKLLGEPASVELVGILGYYALVSMTLNAFNVAPDPNQPVPFREPAAQS
jgi:4-carboxymuconolactone decarboxylase